MNYLFKTISSKWLLGVSAVCSFAFYYVILVHYKILQPDLDEHIDISNKMWASMRLPAHPLFYLLIQLLSGFSQKLNIQIWAAWFIFSIAQWLKILVSFKIIEELFGYKPNYLSSALILGLQLFSNFSPWHPFFIKEHLSINYFHNGTLLLSMPFSMLLFWQGLRYLKSESIHDLNWMILWGALVAISKPSFLFCYIAAFPLYVLLLKGFTLAFFRSVALAAILTSFILLQSIYLHYLPPAYIEKIKISFKPFFLFGSWQNHIKILVSTLGLALVGLLLFRRQIRVTGEFRLVFAMLITAYFIAFNFVDEINGVLFTNMTWQVPIVLNILYVCIIGIVANSAEPMGWSRRLPFLVVFMLYFGYGLYYLYNVWAFRTFFI